MQTAEAMRQRRKDIVAAAQYLLSQEDISAFSIRKLASAAGVSVATIYNLIGNRQAVLFSIIQGLTEEMRVEQADLDQTAALGFVERQLKTLISFTKSREDLLRSANLAFDQLSREVEWSELTTRIVKNAETTYVECFKRAAATGELRGDISARVLSGLVYKVYFDATMNWAFRRISMNQYKKTAIRDALVVLLADASDSSRSQILARLSHY